MLSSSCLTQSPGWIQENTRDWRMVTGWEKPRNVQDPRGCPENSQNIGWIQIGRDPPLNVQLLQSPTVLSTAHTRQTGGARVRLCMCAHVPFWVCLFIGSGPVQHGGPLQSLLQVPCLESDFQARSSLQPKPPQRWKSLPGSQLAALDSTSLQPDTDSTLTDIRKVAQAITQIKLEVRRSMKMHNLMSCLFLSIMAHQKWLMRGPVVKEPTEHM